MTRPVPIRDITQFDDEADVVGVCYGIPGACAALGAARGRL